MSSAEIPSPKMRGGAPMRQDPLSKYNRSPVKTRNSEPGRLRYSQPFAPRYVSTCPIAPVPPHAVHAAKPATPSATDVAKARLPAHEQARQQHDRPQLHERRDDVGKPAREWTPAVHQGRTAHGQGDADEIEPRVDDEQHRRREREVRPTARLPHTRNSKKTTNP